MGGIDEAALDRLSLVTEMTKHIRIRATGGRSTTSDLGQFSPVFVWLLRVIVFDVRHIKLMVSRLFIDNQFYFFIIIIFLLLVRLFSCPMSDAHIIIF